MTVTSTTLSSNTSKDWNSKLDNVTYKQTRRGYDGGYSFNFVHALSCVNDFKTKEYSNFYLSRDIPLDYVISLNIPKFTSQRSITTLKSGENLLSYSLPLTSYEYRIPEFSDAGELFDIRFMEGQLCTVELDVDGDIFNLAIDSTDSVIFIRATSVVDDLSAAQPHVFKYMFGNDYNFIYLIKPTSGNDKIIRRSGNGLELIELTETNKHLYNTSHFEVNRSKTTDLNIGPNTSFIRYENESNLIDISSSDFDLTNNFLLHSQTTGGFTDFLVLKNQLAKNDVFTNSNNLLSSNYINPVNEFREYTSITSPIDSETSSDLELNYVFYNEVYKIESGTTTFTAPSSMYPFTKLNINDSKFTKSGAFSFTTPQHADKVCRLNVDKNFNGMSLLCTWLSGSPSGDNKVWVDRYYYPDLITKAAALEGKGYFDITYDDNIESLITSNSELSASVPTNKIFDKKSDLVFEVNAQYAYERLASIDAPLTNVIDACNSSTLDYHKDINDAGEITLSFYFKGDDTNWTVRSNRNAIDGGITITKTASEVTFEYALYDNATNSYEVFTTSTIFKKSKDNFILFSYDALNGDGYFFLNNDTILSIVTGVGQYIGKPILYGNIEYNGVDILQPNTDLSLTTLQSEYVVPDLAFIYPILNGVDSIDTIYITLPCGMRNKIDDITAIHSICNSSANKSNQIDVSLNNIGIIPSETMQSLKAYISNVVDTHTPSTTTVNNIKAINYI